MGIKLLVDIHPLLRRRTGVGNYIFYLLREIIQDERVEDVVGVAGMRLWSREDLRHLLDSASPVSHAQGKPGRGAILRRLPWIREIHGWLQTMRLKLEWTRYHDYVFWGGNYYAPRLPGLRSVITVHDLSYLHYPAFHPVGRVRFLHKHLPRILQCASAVAAVSEATREDLLVSLGSIITLPPVFVVTPAAAEYALVSDVREKYQLPEQFILSVGTLEPRKNVARLLDAYQRLDPVLQVTWPLLLVGDKGWLSEELTATLGRQGNVHWLGYVPDEDMPGLYQQAGIFVYVSLFEGFGMPVLEAMANGVPVLTSNTSSLPEAAGGAAMLVNPLSVSDITDSLRTLLQDADLRNTLAALGKAQASRFSWRASASYFLDWCETVHHTI